MIAIIINVIFRWSNLDILELLTCPLNDILQYNVQNSY